MPPAAVTCQLPGCSRPVYVDRHSGVQHGYCSRTHARRAQKLDSSTPLAAAAPAAAVSTEAKRQELLAQLIAMGFPAHKAQRALQVKGNFLGAAIEYASQMVDGPRCGAEPQLSRPAAANPAATRAGEIDSAASTVCENRLLAASPAADGSGPFPIRFAIAILAAGRGRVAPRHDLEQLRALAVAQHAEQRQRHAQRLGLSAPPDLLGLAELVAEQILVHGRIPKPAGRKGFDFPELTEAVQQRIVATAKTGYIQLQEQLGVAEPFISMYAERPALEELHLRARWPIFAYKARLSSLGQPVGLVAMDIERDGVPAILRAAAGADAGTEENQVCWFCDKRGHVLRNCPEREAKRLAHGTRRAILHFFAARDRFLLIDGADRRQPAAGGAAVGLRRRYMFLGREYEYLMDKDLGGNFTLRYFSPKDCHDCKWLSSATHLLRAPPFGDFSEVKPGRIGDRVGLAFSTTIPIMILDPPPPASRTAGARAVVDLTCDGGASGQVRLLEAVYHDGFDFADGQGQFGDDVRKSIQDVLQLQEPADAIQMRCFGAKGVLVHMPGTLGVGLRPSQVKFVSASSTLDVITVAKADTARSSPLIRQFIYLLESLGVPATRFAKLQATSYRQRIQAALQPQTPAKRIKKLEALKKEITGIEGKKIRISLPRGSGQCLLLLGMVDEHDCLQAGEVLVDDGTAFMEPVDVLVGRSPAYHPGDLQVLRAVPKPDSMIKARATRRGCLVFSAKGRRPVFDGMGQGDVDGDKYYVLSEKSLFPPSTTENVAADYGSQTERPRHKPGNGPCSPEEGHPDAQLQLAYAMMERLVTPGKGGALALGQIVTEWMATCDQLGATSNAAKRLVNLALDAHGVRAMDLEELESFEEKWTEAVQLSTRQRPDYFLSRLHEGTPAAEAGVIHGAETPAIASSNSVVGLLSRLTARVAQSIDLALEQLRQRDHVADHHHVLQFLMDQIAEAEKEFQVPLRELETQRAAARSIEPGEAAGTPLPQCRAVAKRIAKDRDLARDLDELELERLDIGVLEAWVQVLDEQSRQPGMDVVEQRQRARRIGQLTSSIQMKRLLAEDFGAAFFDAGTGNGGNGGDVGNGTSGSCSQRAARDSLGPKRTRHD
eukprot:SAG31_NODE_539_length_14296_cov_14.408819_8_plen_1116_part_00